MTQVSFHNIRVGDRVVWSHQVQEQEGDRFAELSGDQNPLHMEDAFGRRHAFRGRVVHGMLVSSFLSRVLGMELPGPGVLWLSQNSRFLQPVYIGDVIYIEVQVTQKSESLRTLVLSTVVRNQNEETVLTGEAKVMMLEGEHSQSLVGKVALITGASRGIGASLAKTLGVNRLKVAVNYRSNRSAADAVVESISAAGGEGVAIPADVSTSEGAHSLAQRVLEHFGQVNILIHNASPSIIRKPLFEHSWEELDGYWQTYVQGAFTLAQQLIPSMKKSGYGRIIHILTSAISGNPPPELGGYVAGKCGLWGLTKGMATELASEGITVNAVSPGAVITDQWSEISEVRRRAMAMRNPMRRLASPEDVVHAVLFLVSPASSYLTGVNLSLTGGEVIFP